MRPCLHRFNTTVTEIVILLFNVDWFWVERYVPGSRHDDLQLLFLGEGTFICIFDKVGTITFAFSLAFGVIFIVLTVYSILEMQGKSLTSFGRRIAFDGTIETTGLDLDRVFQG